MPLSPRLQQRVQDPAPDPVVRVRVNPDARCDLVRDAKTNAGHILRQPVRILLHDLVQSHAVLLIDLDRERVGDAVLLQKKHRIPGVFFLLDLLRDLPRLPLADALDLRKPVRFLLDDPKRIVPEMPHDPGGERRADPLDRAGAQIALHRDPVLRRDHRKPLHLELFPVDRVIHVSALRLDALALVQVGEDARAGDLHILHLEVDHTVTVLRIFENNMLDKPFQFLQVAVPP